MTHLGMLANSGAGTLVVEATHVERRGRITHGCLGLYSDACEAALERVVAHCRQIGTAKLAIQLAHAGRKASAQRPWDGAKALSANEDPWPTIAPSALPFGTGWHTPSAMTEDDMVRVSAAFTDAAKRAVRLGFDAIELHFAHGYLLHSFVSPVSNKRNDEWGGSLASRLRYPLECTRAVRAVVPCGLPLGARITGSDWVENGLKADDAVTLAKALKEAGLDYVDVSSGGISADVRMPTSAGYNVAIAAQIRRETGLPVRTVGMIANAKQAEEIIADGNADMVALARGFLDDPHWGWHAAQTLSADVARPAQYSRAAPALWPGAALRG
jgi:NADPH2 dehydrogenase